MVDGEGVRLVTDQVLWSDRSLLVNMDAFTTMGMSPPPLFPNPYSCSSNPSNHRECRACIWRHRARNVEYHFVQPNRAC